MSLYALTFEVDVVVEADSEEDAIWEGQSSIGEAARDCLFDGPTSSREVKTESDLPDPEWLDSLPYGGKDDRTVRQILAAPDAEPEPVKDVWTLPMFPEAAKP